MEKLTFDSRGLSTSDGFDAYDALYRLGTDVTCVPGNFRATVSARRYSQLLVFNRNLSGLRHERTPKRVVSDGFNHATVQLVLAGRLGFATGEERKWVGPGEMAVFDTRRPLHTRTDCARFITVSVARDLFEEALPPAVDFHGRIFAHGVAPVVRDTIRLLAGCDGAPDPAAAEVAASIVGAMIGAMLGMGASPSRATATNAIKFRRAERFIRANIANVDLSAELIADRIGVSRSVLYRMFEAEGGVARSIKRERLLAVRKALSSPVSPCSISRVAKRCGFANEAHFCRSFREEFGTTPTSYRDTRRAIEAGSAFFHWFSDFL